MEYHLKNICWAYWRFALARPMQRKITTAAMGSSVLGLPRHQWSRNGRDGGSLWNPEIDSLPRIYSSRLLLVLMISTPPNTSDEPMICINEMLSPKIR